jgi:uncharacterized protein YbjT (DUF2867 family)
MQQAKIVVAGATGRLGRHVVDVLGAAGHEVVPVSRSARVDVITGDGLPEALKDADAIIDVVAGPSSGQRPATEFFTTAARNMQQAGERAGVARYVVVSIIGIEKSAGGYGSAKLAHEQAVLDPDSEPAADGSLLPGPHAKLAGPTFEEWLTTQPDSGSTGA